MESRLQVKFYIYHTKTAPRRMDITRVQRMMMMVTATNSIQFLACHNPLTGQPKETCRLYIVGYTDKQTDGRTEQTNRWLEIRPVQQIDRYLDLFHSSLTRWFFIINTRTTHTIYLWLWNVKLLTEYSLTIGQCWISPVLLFGFGWLTIYNKLVDAHVHGLQSYLDKKRAAIVWLFCWTLLKWSSISFSLQGHFFTILALRHFIN